MLGRIGLLFTHNNSGRPKGGQPVCVCQDTFRSSAIKASCSEQPRPAIRGTEIMRHGPAPALFGGLPSHS